MNHEVFVTGSTGLVGKALVPHLLERGYNVRILVRGKAPFTAHPLLKIIKGDMLHGHALKAGCSGVQTVIHLAARKNDERDSEAVNVQGAQLLAQTAVDAGVTHIVHLSTQSVLLPKKGIYAQTKTDAERALEDSGLPVTQMRCSVVYGSEPEGVVGSIANFAKLPMVPVIGKGGGHFAPIHRDDLAEAIVRVLEKPELHGNTFDVGGPEVLSFTEIAEKILKERGTPRKFFYIPSSVAMLMARVFSVLPRSPLTVSNVLGAIQDVPMDPKPFLHVIDLQPRTFEEGLQECDFLKPPSEADVMLQYVLSGYHHAPGVLPEVRARYMHALEVYGLTDAAALTPDVLHAPGTLRALDWLTKLRAPQCALQRKFLIAAAVRETTPETAATLLPPSRGMAHVVMNLMGIGIAQLIVVIRTLVLLLRPNLWKRYVA